MVRSAPCTEADAMVDTLKLTAKTKPRNVDFLMPIPIGMIARSKMARTAKSIAHHRSGKQLHSRAGRERIARALFSTDSDRRLSLD